MLYGMSVNMKLCLRYSELLEILKMGIGITRYDCDTSEFGVYCLDIIDCMFHLVLLLRLFLCNFRSDGLLCLRWVVVRLRVR